ncbi:MAG: hypothetical protein ACRCVV_06380 [Shewanella sp.]
MLQQKMPLKPLTFGLWHPKFIQALRLWLIALIVNLVVAAPLLADVAVTQDTVTTTEPSLSSLPQPKNNKHLPLGTLLDSQGQPLSLPHHSQSALEYSGPQLTTEAASPPRRATPQRAHSSPLSHSSKPSRASTMTSSNQKPANTKRLSRQHIANDPSCRWLDNRLNQLESRHNSQLNPPSQYHAQELHARQQEWRCLKCGAEGPAQADYARCQYRRDTAAK